VRSSLLVIFCLLVYTVRAAESRLPKTINACTFLKDEEIARILGRGIFPGERHDSGAVVASDYVTPGTYSSTCLWRVVTNGPLPEDPNLSLGGASYVILNVMQWPLGSGRAKKFLQSFRDAARDGTIDQVPVPLRIADDGLWWGDGVAAYKGDRSFGVSVHLVGARTKERGMEEALARNIVRRL
jgi:hypothetical protein